jgi:hypothetical protein
VLLTDKVLTSFKGKIVKVMKHLEKWFSTNNLMINMERVKAILFQGRGSSLIHRPFLYLNNKEITYLSALKCLGIHRKLKLGHSYAISLSKIKQSSLFD